MNDDYRNMIHDMLDRIVFPTDMESMLVVALDPQEEGPSGLITLGRVQTLPGAPEPTSQAIDAIRSRNLAYVLSCSRFMMVHYNNYPCMEGLPEHAKLLGRIAIPISDMVDEGFAVIALFRGPLGVLIPAMYIHSESWVNELLDRMNAHVGGYDVESREEREDEELGG